MQARRVLSQAAGIQVASSQLSTQTKGDVSKSSCSNKILTPCFWKGGLNSHYHLKWKTVANTIFMSRMRKLRPREM